LGDLSVLDPDINKNLLSELNPNIILVALNFSKGSILESFGNFHSDRSSYVKFLQNKGASRELCQLKLRHLEKSAIDHYLRVDLQALKIFEAKIFG